MSTPDDQERVVPIALPGPDAEKSLPIVLAKDGTVVLSYMAFIVRKDVHMVVSFHVAFGHRFGPPDGRGLKPGAYEVKGSSWVRDSFGGKGKHYVFAFPDAVFECAAEGYGSEEIAEDDDVVRVMARRLYQ